MKFEYAGVGNISHVRQDKVIVGQLMIQLKADELMPDENSIPRWHDVKVNVTIPEQDGLPLDQAEALILEAAKKVLAMSAEAIAAARTDDDLFKISIP
ncbi:MAG TPA: hypothetical protein VMF90_15025 [Rhizobiaceae bacterium]|nr:hypothetical protein [Rhizobiaceae bacterium]